MPKQRLLAGMARLPYMSTGAAGSVFGNYKAFLHCPEHNRMPNIARHRFSWPMWRASSLALVLSATGGQFRSCFGHIFVPPLLALVPMRGTSASQPASQNLQTIWSAGGGGKTDYLKHRAPQAPLGTTVAPTLSTVQYVLARGIMFRAVHAHSRHPLATLRVATSYRCV